MSPEIPTRDDAEDSGRYVEHDGVRIRYEVHGDGPPLLLYHGFSGSIEGWRRCGYLALLPRRFRVIAIDARGHGRSDKPRDTAQYVMEKLTRDVVAVLDALGVERTHFWGHSMGSTVGFALWQQFPEHIATLVNCGGIPRADAEQSNRLRQWAEVYKTGDPTLISRAFDCPLVLVQYILAKNEAHALAATSLGLLAWSGIDPSQFDIPSFHYTGELDRRLSTFRRLIAEIPEAECVELPRRDHLTIFTRGGPILPRVLDFIERHPIV